MRRIVETIFLSYSDPPFAFLFAVYDRDEANPAMHIRCHPTIRFSPQGSPLLLVSVLDHQLADQLMAQGKLDQETLQSDFHRLITQGVCKEIFAIRTSSAEELDLFRYSLRINSTRMRRGAWQSKNVPRGETSPWLSSFISPLYAENVNVGKWNCFKATLAAEGGPQCSGCAIIYNRLKQCSRCMSALYCSVTCQKRHWPLHKTVCLPCRDTSNDPSPPPPSSLLFSLEITPEEIDEMANGLAHYIESLQ